MFFNYYWFKLPTLCNILYRTEINCDNCELWFAKEIATLSDQHLPSACFYDSFMTFVAMDANELLVKCIFCTWVQPSCIEANAILLCENTFPLPSFISIKCIRLHFHKILFIYYDFVSEAFIFKVKEKCHYLVMVSGAEKMQLSQLQLLW